MVRESSNNWEGMSSSMMFDSRRDYRGSRSALLSDLEEGGVKIPMSYSTSEIAEQENDRAIDDLHDRVSILKRLTVDVHEEVQSHNKLLDRMGTHMESARGQLSGTVNRFKKVLETKSGRNMLTIIASFVVVFFLVYILIK